MESPHYLQLSLSPVELLILKNLVGTMKEKPGPPGLSSLCDNLEKRMEPLIAQLTRQQQEEAMKQLTGMLRSR